ncbi:YceI family protein [Zoogloea sp.]|uniref:YceI family protein n=1 Tax=Zoogloea sp. TaxID=49181 RepID=UPI0025F1E186|nr:YceI family protein [Zoogloea sp.]MCK6396013.1 YceI family protein [Zoogloea sp.]
MVWNPLSPRRLMAAALGLALASGTCQADPQRYVIDPDHFSIGFKVEHIGYASILGLFLKARGEFVYDEDTRQLVSGKVHVAADSVFSNHAGRDNHIRESDFLNAREFPEIVFQATRYTPTGAGSGKLDGELTLLGQTRPVSLDVRLNKAAPYPFAHRRHTLGLSASTTLLRSQWGMRYGVDAGLVGDAVRLDFEFEAARQ